MRPSTALRVFLVAIFIFSCSVPARSSFVELIEKGFGEKCKSTVESFPMDAAKCLKKATSSSLGLQVVIDAMIKKFKSASGSGAAGVTFDVQDLKGILTNIRRNICPKDGMKSEIIKCLLAPANWPCMDKPLRYLVKNYIDLLLIKPLDDFCLYCKPLGHATLRAQMKIEQCINNNLDDEKNCFDLKKLDIKNIYGFLKDSNQCVLDLAISKHCDKRGIPLFKRFFKYALHDILGYPDF